MQPNIIAAANIAMKRSDELKGIIGALKFVTGPYAMFRCCVSEMIVYCPDAQLKCLTTEQLASIIAHEAKHIFRGDFNEFKRRNVFFWNLAADLVINKELKEEGFHVVPGWATPKSLGVAPNLTDVQYYYMLQKIWIQ